MAEDEEDFTATYGYTINMADGSLKKIEKGIEPGQVKELQQVCVSDLERIRSLHDETLATIPTVTLIPEEMSNYVHQGNGEVAPLVTHSLLHQLPVLENDEMEKLRNSPRDLEALYTQFQFPQDFIFQASSSLLLEVRLNLPQDVQTEAKRKGEQLVTHLGLQCAAFYKEIWGSVVCIHVAPLPKNWKDAEEKKSTYVPVLNFIKPQYQTFYMKNVQLYLNEGQQLRDGQRILIAFGKKPSPFITFNSGWAHSANKQLTSLVGGIYRRPSPGPPLEETSRTYRFYDAPEKGGLYPYHAKFPPFKGFLLLGNHLRFQIIYNDLFKALLLCMPVISNSTHHETTQADISVPHLKDSSHTTTSKGPATTMSRRKLAFPPPLYPAAAYSSPLPPQYFQPYNPSSFYIPTQLPPPQVIYSPPQTPPASRNPNYKGKKYNPNYVHPKHATYGHSQLNTQGPWTGEPVYPQQQLGLAKSQRRGRKVAGFFVKGDNANGTRHTQNGRHGDSRTPVSQQGHLSNEPHTFYNPYYSVAYPTSFLQPPTPVGQQHQTSRRSTQATTKHNRRKSDKGRRTQLSSRSGLKESDNGLEF
jgi:hypothetical protein